MAPRTAAALFLIATGFAARPAASWATRAGLVEIFEARHRALVIAEFTARGKPFDGSFWTTPFHGETPAAVLRERAAGSAREIQATLERGVALGLLPSCEFEILERLRARENQRMAAAKRRGAPSYGILHWETLPWLEQLADRVRILEKRRRAGLQGGAP